MCVCIWLRFGTENVRLVYKRCKYIMYTNYMYIALPNTQSSAIRRESGKQMATHYCNTYRVVLIIGDNYSSMYDIVIILLNVRYLCTTLIPNIDNVLVTNNVKKEESHPPILACIRILLV